MKNKILSIIIIIVLSTILGLAYNASTNLSLRLLEATDDIRPFREDFNYNFELVDDIFDDVSRIEFSYLDGVTSSIQDQIDSVGSGAVDTSGTPVANDIAVFTDLNTIEGLNYAELKAVLDLDIGTDIQAYDAGLLSIAGLTTAANKSIYTTALDTYTTYTLTAFARTILDDADEATVKATLNLEIGTDVQAYDAALASISGLTYVSPSFIKLTADDTYAVRTITEVITDLALDSDDLSDVASIAMLDETETVTGFWTFDKKVGINKANDTPASGPYLILRRARAGVTSVADDDYLGRLLFYGYHTDAYDHGATIRAVVDGTPSTDTDMPTRLEFLTSPDGSATPVLAMTIDEAQVVTFANDLADSEISDTLTSSVLVPSGETDFGAHSVGFTLQTATGDGDTTIDWRLGLYFKFTHDNMAETFTFTAPTNPCHMTLIILEDGNGAHDCTWPVAVTWLGTEPTWTDGGAGKGIVVAIVYDGTTFWCQGTPWEG